MEYNIISFDNLVHWSMQHEKLRIQLEKLISEHSEHPINIGTIIEENLRYDQNVPFIGKLIVLIENENIIGVAKVELDKNNINYISAVHIKSIYRGKGLCQKLLKTLIDSFNSSSIFELDVNAANIGAIKCYQNIGFIIVQTKDIGSDGIGYTMRLVK